MQNFLPLQVGAQATMKEPDFVRATALMTVLPNLAERTFLQEAGVGILVLKFLLAFFAQRDTCAVETVWTIAPLLIQLANVFSVAGVGRPHLAAPVVWFISILYDWILLAKVLQQFLYPVGLQTELTLPFLVVDFVLVLVRPEAKP